MRFTRVAAAAAAAAVLAVLAGCDLVGGAHGRLVVGNIIPAYGTVAGGTPYHVVFYQPGTVMDPWEDYDTAPRAAAFDGVFPGGAADFVDTANFQLTDVPAGLYVVFAWVDTDTAGSFDAGQDMWGFYYGNPGSNTLTQPPANVVVPESGVVDLDLWVGFNQG